MQDDSFLLKKWPVSVVGHEVGAYLPKCLLLNLEQSDWVMMQTASLQTEY